MSALLAKPSKVDTCHYDLTRKEYWPRFNGVLIALYKHGSELVGFWTLPASYEALTSLPEGVFPSSIDRSANVAKIIAPSGLEGAVSKWRHQLKISLELHVYNPNDVIEVLYAPDFKKIKVAGPIQSVVLESVPQKIKVLVVDDSKVIRTLLKDALANKGSFEIVAETGSPKEVADLISRHQPDVMTLDINMPEMNGVELIESLGRHRLPPTVVVSSLNMNEGTLVMRALENGAFDYIQKPSMEERQEFALQLAEKLTVAAQSRAKVYRPSSSGPSLRQAKLSTDGLIVIGASTGGTEAVKAILRHLPKEVPPILIVQHIPPVFSRAFAESLDTLCEFNVSEAVDGDILKPNHAYVAPGGLQMRLEHAGANYKLRIAQGEKVSGHAPSVDCLFNSVAQVYKGKALAMLLTGMGADGAKGLLSLHQKNVFTLAQNEETCVVFGMPKQAIKLNAAQKIVGLHEMAHEVGNYFKKG